MTHTDTFVQRVRTLTGAGCLSEIGLITRELGYRKALLVYDQGIGNTDIPARIMASLETEGVAYSIFDRVQSDPPSYLVDEGAALCKETCCDCVIGIGGGSAIDVAKGINLLRFNEGGILDYVATLDYNPCHGLLVIPTTSGTGSELSDGAIITDTANNKKVPVICVNNMADYVLLDPELTAGMPPRLTMLTGLDAFTHLVEGYTSTRATIMTEMVCEAAMESIVENLPRALLNGKDLQARARMQAAASLGGWMLYSCGTHAGHSTAHALGGNLHMIHGAACAYMLPALLQLICPAVPGKVKKIGQILGASFNGDENAETIGKITAEAFRSFCWTLGLPPVEEVVVSPALLDEMADQIVHDGLTRNTPVAVSMDVARSLLLQALKR